MGPGGTHRTRCIAGSRDKSWAPRGLAGRGPRAGGAGPPRTGLRAEERTGAGGAAWTRPRAEGGAAGVACAPLRAAGRDLLASPLRGHTGRLKGSGRSDLAAARRAVSAAERSALIAGVSGPGALPGAGVQETGGGPRVPRGGPFRNWGLLGAGGAAAGGGQGINSESGGSNPSPVMQSKGTQCFWHYF